MYRRWPFFRNFLANVQQALVKANMEIAKEYSRICEDKEVADRVYGLIKNEYDASVEQVMRVTEKDELLGETPQLKERLDKRNLYLDPLNASQVILLGRTRKAEAEDNAEELELWTEPLLRTIKAIAASMRNTG